VLGEIGPPPISEIERWADRLEVYCDLDLRFFYLYTSYTLYTSSFDAKIIGIQLNTIEFSWARPWEQKMGHWRSKPP